MEKFNLNIKRTELKLHFSVLLDNYPISNYERFIKTSLTLDYLVIKDPKYRQASGEPHALKRARVVREKGDNLYLCLSTCERFQGPIEIFSW